MTAHVTLVGNLTRAPELRYTTGGQPQTTIGIAVSRRYQRDGEWTEQTSYFNIIAWGTLAEHAAASLTKGARIIATGRLEQRSYDTKDGDKRTVIELNADEIGAGLRYATVDITKVDRSDSPAPARKPAQVDEEPF